MILITGATGFVGRNLILSLSEKSDNLIGQFRREEKLEETKKLLKFIIVQLTYQWHYIKPII